MVLSGTLLNYNLSLLFTEPQRVGVPGIWELGNVTQGCLLSTKQWPFVRSAGSLATAGALSNNPRSVDIYPTESFPYLDKCPIPSPGHLQEATPG